MQALLASPSPSSGRVSAEKPGWKRASVVAGEEEEKGSRERLEGRVVKLVWERSRLEVEVLRGVWLVVSLRIALPEIRSSGDWETSSEGEGRRTRLRSNDPN